MSHGSLHDPPRRARAPTMQRAVLLSVEAVVLDEEGFQLVEEVPVELAQAGEVPLRRSARGHTDEAVIALPAVVGTLLTLEHPDEAAGNDRTHGHGCVEEHQHVERVAVPATGP